MFDKINHLINFMEVRKLKGSVCESVGRRFEPCRACHFNKEAKDVALVPFSIFWKIFLGNYRATCLGLFGLMISWVFQFRNNSRFRIAPRVECILK